MSHIRSEQGSKKTLFITDLGTLKNWSVEASAPDK
jgi:hypothetical protein